MIAFKKKKEKKFKSFLDSWKKQQRTSIFGFLALCYEATRHDGNVFGTVQDKKIQQKETFFGGGLDCH